MIRVRAEAKGWRCGWSAPDALPTHVLGDAHHLRQVLINLLGNAVKYTDQGQVTAAGGAAGAGADSLRGERHRPRHRPGGPGRIFDPFYQTENGIAWGRGPDSGSPSAGSSCA
jgi:K+-sensing histidine kinase KdpD